MPPICSDGPHIFGCPLYIHNTCFVRLRGCLYAPIHLYIPCMFRCPQYVWTPSYDYMPPMFGYPLYIHNTKKACFVRLRGCPHGLTHLYTTLYVWTSPYVQMPAKCTGASNGMRGIQAYWGYPIIGVSNAWGHPNILGHPNIWGCPNIGSIQKYGGVQIYGGTSKHMGVSKHRVSKCMGASNHTGGIQT